MAASKRYKKSNTRNRKSSKNKRVKKRDRQLDREERILKTLSTFSRLPDDALVNIYVVSRLRGRSVSSSWRDLKMGRLPRPIHISDRCTRWRVGDIRANLSEVAHGG